LVFSGVFLCTLWRIFAYFYWRVFVYSILPLTTMLHMGLLFFSIIHETLFPEKTYAGRAGLMSRRFLVVSSRTIPSACAWNWRVTILYHIFEVYNGSDASVQLARPQCSV